MTLLMHNPKPPRSWRLRVMDHVIITALVLGVLALLLWRLIFVAVPPGSVGVLYRLFSGGTETTWVFPEGLAIKWPFNSIVPYEVRTQARDYRAVVLSQNGLIITIDLTTLFHIVPEEAGLLHKEVGPDYVNRIIYPSSIEAVRQVVGNYGPHDLYTTNNLEMQEKVLERLRGINNGRHLEFEDVIIRTIALPTEVNQAITQKLVQEQVAASYDFRVLREKREAERKRIEAIGIQTFYSIVANSLTPSLLTWRGMEATVEIAQSPNSKVVIVGGGKDQLPLILGSDIANLPALPPPAAVSPLRNPLPDLDRLPPLFPGTSSADSTSGDGNSAGANGDAATTSPSAVPSEPLQPAPELPSNPDKKQ